MWPCLNVYVYVCVCVWTCRLDAHRETHKQSCTYSYRAQKGKREFRSNLVPFPPVVSFFLSFVRCRNHTSTGTTTVDKFISLAVDGILLHNALFSGLGILTNGSFHVFCVGHFIAIKNSNCQIEWWRCQYTLASQLLSSELLVGSIFPRHQIGPHFVTKVTPYY